MGAAKNDVHVGFPSVAGLPSVSPSRIAVNGRQTPAHGDYSLHFGRDGRFGARFGCNSMGGTYRIAGGTLIVGNLNQTLMGCPDPAASFESQGAAILGQPMQVAFTSNERMSLSNGAGSISADPLR